jgi:hypothetical protein
VRAATPNPNILIVSVVLHFAESLQPLIFVYDFVTVNLASASSNKAATITDRDSIVAAIKAVVMSMLEL